jgi:tRNA G18 (ribose-2'-O)-methylase SpoU
LISDWNEVLLSTSNATAPPPAAGAAASSEAGFSLPSSLPSSSLGFHVLIAESESILSKVAGFPISRGALACGVVPTDRTEEWLDSYLTRKLEMISMDVKKHKISSTSLRLLALDGICDNANLGSMIRTASAFGVDAVVLSQDTADAWYRRTVRVSMGHIAWVPVVRVKNLASFVNKWDPQSGHHRQQKGITCYAAVVQSADLILDETPRGDVPMAWCCVMGNEGNGISTEVLERCSHRIRIDMVNGVDSLSVPVAREILLHGLREKEDIIKH